MATESDIEFVLRLEPKPKGTVYLSMSWQPGEGQDFGYRLIERLDKQGYLVVGDAKGFEGMDPKRLLRIMGGSDGFLSSLPYRPDNPSRTSVFMMDEIRLAVTSGLPIAIIYDERVGITESRSGDAVELLFADSTTLAIPASQLVLCQGFDFGVAKSEELVLVDLSDFLARARPSDSKIEPYAFLITRLQTDFAQPRTACIAAVEHAAGVPCLWVSSTDYRSNVDDTIERVRLLIKHSVFVVAEISLTDENVGTDNPSRAHEIGLATAYRKPLILASHAPPRHPYHGLVSRQFVWWDNEVELHELLKAQIHLERGVIGRHVYNRDIKNVAAGVGTTGFLGKSFDSRAAPAWAAPASISAAQRWIYATSLGVIVFCSALLLRQIGYDDTLDLGATLGGIVALLFASQVRDSMFGALRRIDFLRWLVPLLATLLLIATIIVLRPAETKAGAVPAPASSGGAPERALTPGRG